MAGHGISAGPPTATTAEDSLFGSEKCLEGLSDVIIPSSCRERSRIDHMRAVGMVLHRCLDVAASECHCILPDPCADGYPVRNRAAEYECL